MKRFLHFVFGDPVAIGFMVVGAGLLVAALHFGVNPADGSVVVASIRDTWVPVALFFATLPAMVVMFGTGGGPIGAPLMFLIQVAAWWVLGRAASWLLSLLSRFTPPH